MLIRRRKALHTTGNIERVLKVSSQQEQTACFPKHCRCYRWILSPEKRALSKVPRKVELFMLLTPRSTIHAHDSTLKIAEVQLIHPKPPCYSRDCTAVWCLLQCCVQIFSDKPEIRGQTAPKPVSTHACQIGGGCMLVALEDVVFRSNCSTSLNFHIEEPTSGSTSAWILLLGGTFFLVYICFAICAARLTRCFPPINSGA